MGGRWGGGGGGVGGGERTSGERIPALKASWKVKVLDEFVQEICLEKR